MATLRENVFLSAGLPSGNWAIDYYIMINVVVLPPTVNFRMWLLVNNNIWLLCICIYTMMEAGKAKRSRSFTS